MRHTCDPQQRSSALLTPGYGREKQTLHVVGEWPRVSSTLFPAFTFPTILSQMRWPAYGYKSERAPTERVSTSRAAYGRIENRFSYTPLQVFFVKPLKFNR